MLPLDLVSHGEVARSQDFADVFDVIAPSVHFVSRNLMTLKNRLDVTKDKYLLKGNGFV